MNIESISRLLTPFRSASQEQTAKTENAKPQAEEAVAISSGFGKAAALGDGAADRSQRVAELKQQVEAGTYRPDTNAVANAVARELFA